MRFIRRFSYMLWFYWNLPNMFRACLLFGPDSATMMARDLSNEDIRETILENWQNEVCDLLPHRYKWILKQLAAAGVLSKDDCLVHLLLAGVPVDLGPDVAVLNLAGSLDKSAQEVFPWRTNRVILDSIPEDLEHLRRKIMQFDEDFAKAWKLESAIEIFYYLSMYSQGEQEKADTEP